MIININLHLVLKIFKKISSTDKEYILIFKQIKEKE